MRFSFVTRLAALGAVFGLLLAVPAAAQMRPMGESQHESGVTACSGHGNTNFDRCFCDPGWSGPQCASQDVRPNCGDHGKAWYGKCRCQAGWNGKLCDSPPLACAQGKPENGKCVCNVGWSGVSCDARAY